MTAQFEQFRLLAQGHGDEWMDILFWVVVVAVWVIGGIVKAAGAKRKDQKRQPVSRKPARQESFLERLAKKAEELQHAAELQSRKGAERSRQTASRSQQQRPAKPAQPAPGQVTVRTGRGGQPVLVYERQGSPAAAPHERPRPPRPAPTRSERQHRRKPKPAPLPTPQQTPVALPVIPDMPSGDVMTSKPAVAVRAGDSLLVDYSDPRALRRAILQMEILGRPLALREPFE